MVKLRALRHSDISTLDELWKKHWADEFSFPDIKARQTDAVAVNGDQIVGYGQVKLFPEFMLFMDPTISHRAKVETLKLLMEKALTECKVADLSDVYCFIRDPDFSLLIQKHFGFKSIVQPGELLLKNLE
jgi:hypothetical protein